MDLSKIKIGVWHVFGAHGCESPEQIIERKRNELAANGWTLWSFRLRRPAALSTWQRELTAASSPAVVFCSDSAGAKDPARHVGKVQTTDCRSYQVVGEDKWRSFPKGVRVPHPFRGRNHQASAFIIRSINSPAAAFMSPAVEWWSEGSWRQDRLPTRGEYLIRRGGTIPLRPVRAILELQPPYFALVSSETARAI